MPGVPQSWYAGGEWLADGEQLSWVAANGRSRSGTRFRTKPARRSILVRATSARRGVPDRQRLALAGSDQTIKIWEASPVPEALVLGEGGNVALARDGKRLATMGSDVKIWDPITGRQMQTWHWPPDWHVMAVAWSPDGKRLVSSSVQTFPGALKMWDAETERELHVWIGHIGPPYAVAWSPDGKWLATCGMDKLVKVWNAIAPDKEIQKLEGHTGLVLSVAWHPDENRVASAGDDGTVKLWNLSDATKTMSLGGHAGAVRSVAWSPDGQRLASAGADGIMVWDARSGTKNCSACEVIPT